MAPRNSFRFPLVLFSLIALLAAAFLPTQTAAAAKFSASTPNLAAFIQSVQNGQAGFVRGVYVENVLAFPVIQQPSYNPTYVSDKANVVTEFGAAAQYGNVGLLGHNTLAGKEFSNLQAGQVITLVYGDGTTASFRVARILRYEALDPANVNSAFRDLATGSVLTSSEMFALAYGGTRRVTFQTCIEANGNSSWGRMFVIAEPAP